ncbi:abortive infection family protein [Burkholderia sp. BCC1047]|uniref:abortive infection family protein n=1 Tax=Burkholderia sp. BCC1047 TaxID=2676299 RepID=UPI00158B91F9|nr:abortive infection family protein [Burkholderia sp. BCC1047]
MDDAVLASLFKAIGEQLRARVARIDASLAAVKKAVEAESVTIDVAMTSSITGFDNATLAQDWHRALTALSLDSTDAQARVYTLFETLCLSILAARGVTPPANQVLRYVLKACLDELLRGEPEQAKEAARQILNAINSIGTGIGALRNSFSTAHGTLPDTMPLDPAYAMLAKNAVATAAIFLLSRHQANPPVGPVDASSTPSDGRAASTP